MADRIVVMKDGRIQQIDTPQRLYDAPCNLFVAGFISSPQMNFWEVTVTEKDGESIVSLGPYDIPLHCGKGMDTALKAYSGKTVVLGIRPEDLHTEPAFLDASADATITMHVEIAELMGAEVYLYGECAGNTITVRAPSRIRAGLGDDIRLAVDVDKLHLFDNETGRVIIN